MPSRSRRPNTSGTPELGRINRRRVIAEIVQNAPISRKEIGDRSGLTGATVSRIVRDLIDGKLISEASSSTPMKRSGRREIGLSLTPSGVYFIGIGINAFTQWISLFGPEHNVIAHHQFKFESLADPRQVLETIYQATEQMIAKSQIPPQMILGGGVTIAGVVEPDSGMLLQAPTLNWPQLPLGEWTTSRLKMPIVVETFANTLNMAESRFGITRDCQHVVLINASLHLGASILLDN